MSHTRTRPVHACLGTALVLGLTSLPGLAVQGQPATQVPLDQHQGMRSAAALGTLRSSAQGGQVLIRSAGEVDGAPAPWSSARFSVATSIHPDFSNAALLTGLNRGLGTVPLATSLGFGGISTGGDMFPPVQANGWLNPTTGAWFAVSFQVAQRANPAADPYGRPGSTLRDLQAMGHEVSDAVVSYYDEGNEQVASELVNAVVVEQTGPQMGVVESGDSEPLGLDFAMGAIAGDPLGVRALLFAPVRDRLFFTFQKEWLEDAANAPFVAVFQAVHGIQPNERTIYRMDWDTAAAPLGWSSPVVAYSEAELFGLAGSPHLDKELDAISVFQAGPADRVIYSTTAASDSPSQVLVHDRFAMGTWAGEVPLRTESGQLVSDQMGLSLGGFATTIDDVRGLCTWDPPEAANPDGAVGWAIDHTGLGLGGKKLGLSLNRSRSHDDKDPKDGPKKATQIPERIDLQVTGLKLGSGGGVVSFFADLGGQVAVKDKMHLKTVSVPAGATTASVSLPWDPATICASIPGGDLHVVALAVPAKKGAAVRASWTTILNP